MITLATAHALMTGTDFAEAHLAFGRKYRRTPLGDYGKNFKRCWDSTDARPCGSYGNGSAMRVAAIG